MTDSTKKPREFWITTRDGEYFADTNPIHVVEYEALLEANREIERLKLLLTTNGISNKIDKDIFEDRPQKSLTAEDFLKFIRKTGEKI